MKNLLLMLSLVTLANAHFLFSGDDIIAQPESNTEKTEITEFKDNIAQSTTDETTKTEEPTEEAEEEQDMPTQNEDDAELNDGTDKKEIDDQV